MYKKSSVEQDEETKIKILVLEKQIEDTKAREAQIKQSNKVSSNISPSKLPARLLSSPFRPSVRSCAKFSHPQPYWSDSAILVLVTGRLGKKEMVPVRRNLGSLQSLHHECHLPLQARRLPTRMKRK